MKNLLSIILKTNTQIRSRFASRVTVEKKCRRVGDVDMRLFGFESLANDLLSFAHWQRRIYFVEKYLPNTVIKNFVDFSIKQSVYCVSSF